MDKNNSDLEFVVQGNVIPGHYVLFIAQSVIFQELPLKPHIVSESYQNSLSIDDYFEVKNDNEITQLILPSNFTLEVIISK